MTIGTCYKPLHTTECKQECIEGKSTGFYKDLDGNIYDYNFEIGTKRVDGEDPKNDSNIEEKDIGKHVDLCELKRTKKIQEHADLKGAAAWMSSGELVIWIIIIGIMYGVYIMFENKMPFKESFLCTDLGGSNYLNMKNIGKIYVIIAFIIMFVVRKLTQTKTLQKIDLLSIKEYITDFIPYSVISLGAYIFFSGYLRMKTSDTPMTGGGPIDYFKNMSVTSLTVYIGIILMVLNSFGTAYLYLKQKSIARKDEYSRSLYWGQITTLLIGGLTAFFIATFACSELLQGGVLKPSFILIKWSILILLVIGCIRMIDILTSKPHKYLQTVHEGLRGKEDWFSIATRAEKEHILNNAASDHAYRRDNGYTIETIEPEDKTAWEKDARKYVHGKCYKINDEKTCGEKGCLFTNGLCKENE